MSKTLRHLTLCKLIKRNEEEIGVNATAAGKGIRVKRQQVRWVSRGEGRPCGLIFRPFIARTQAGQPRFEANSVCVPYARTCRQIKPRDGSFCKLTLFGHSHRWLRGPRTNTSLKRKQKVPARNFADVSFMEKGHSQSQFSPPAATRIAVPPPPATLTTFRCPKTSSAVSAADHFSFCIVLAILLGRLFSDTVNGSLKWCRSL